MELKKGSVVIIKLIRQTNDEKHVYERLLKTIGKVGVIYKCLGSFNKKIFYGVCFSNIGDEIFYDEELEVIGFDNSFSEKCYFCGRSLKDYSFKNTRFNYCPKCLV